MSWRSFRNSQPEQRRDVLVAGEEHGDWSVSLWYWCGSHLGGGWSITPPGKPGRDNLGLLRSMNETAFPDSLWVYAREVAPEGPPSKGAG